MRTASQIRPYKNNQSNTFVTVYCVTWKYNANLGVMHTWILISEVSVSRLFTYMRARKIIPQGPRQSQKKYVTFLRGGVGSSEERPYDVSRGQNRYVNASLSKI